MTTKWGIRGALLVGSAALASCNVTVDFPAPFSIPPEPCSLVDDAGLRWPLACRPGQDCWRHFVYPDLDEDGYAFDCSDDTYVGHTGTDLVITESAMLEGTLVLAAADAEVAFVHDDHYSRCDVDPEHPDCVTPPSEWSEPGESNGEKVCTGRSSNYCDPGSDHHSCYHCFSGGNVIVLRHLAEGPVFATYYAHLGRGTAMVEEGDLVEAGDPIAFVGSAATESPHLHFGVWNQDGWKSESDPWGGPCDALPLFAEQYLFAYDRAWCM